MKRVLIYLVLCILLVNIVYSLDLTKYKDDDEIDVVVLFENSDEKFDKTFDKLKIKEKFTVKSNNGSFSSLSKEENSIKVINSKTKSKFKSFNGIAGKYTKKDLENLMKIKKVKSIEENKVFSSTMDESRYLMSSINFTNLKINGTYFNGTGQTVCVIDTGVDYTHVSFGNCSLLDTQNGSCPTLISGYDWINFDNDPKDDDGHGTHVIGTIVSMDSIYGGVAQGSKVYVVKSLNSTGEGDTASIVSGIDECIANATKFNISVISLSIGSTSTFSSECDSDFPSFTTSINNAIRNNISVIIASGNEGEILELSAPACITNATSVGSVNETDDVSDFSNSATFLDLLAPGEVITSTANGGGFIDKSGTSMATPHVSAAISVLQQYYLKYYGRIMTPIEVINLLKNTGKIIHDSGNGLSFSRIDVFNAAKSIDKDLPKVKIINPLNYNSTNITIFFNSTKLFSLNI